MVVFFKDNFSIQIYLNYGKQAFINLFTLRFLLVICYIDKLHNYKKAFVFLLKVQQEKFLHQKNVTNKLHYYCYFTLTYTT